MRKGTKKATKGGLGDREAGKDYRERTGKENITRGNTIVSQGRIEQVEKRRLTW